MSSSRYQSPTFKTSRLLKQKANYIMSSSATIPCCPIPRKDNHHHSTSINPVSSSTNTPTALPPPPVHTTAPVIATPDAPPPTNNNRPSSTAPRKYVKLATAAAAPTITPSKAGRRRRDISKTMSATKNLRAISLALVQKLKKAPRGIPSTEIANQLAREAVRQVVGTTNNNPNLGQSTNLVTSAELLAVEKNIRRRLYDSLKVLVSVGAINRSRSDKMLHWRGTSHLLPPPSSSSHPIIPTTTQSTTTDVATSPHHSLQLERITTNIQDIRKRLDQKILILRQLQQQRMALERLCFRNRHHQQQQQIRENTDQQNNDAKLHLPFVVVRTANNSDINLVSNPHFTSMTFQFSQNFEIINDSALLDRLFCVDQQDHQQEQQQHIPTTPVKKEPTATIQREQQPTQSETKQLDLQKTPPPCVKQCKQKVETVQLQQKQQACGKEGEREEEGKCINVKHDHHHQLSNNKEAEEEVNSSELVFNSPKRVRLSSGFASPFAKYTSSEKPPRSPATPLVRRRRARSQQRRLAAPFQQPHHRDSNAAQNLPVEPPDPDTPQTPSLSPSILLQGPPCAPTIITTPPRLVSWTNVDSCNDQVIVEHDDDPAATLSTWPKNADDNRALAIACRRLYALPRGDADRDIREHPYLDDDFIGSPLVTPNNWLSNSNSNPALRSKSCTTSLDPRDLPTRQLLFND